MGQSALGGDNNELQEAYQQPYNAVAGSMLAVTKDFVDGLGPVGQSVAPAIQEDVGRLGKVFEMPATDTKINIGGASLRADPNAKKEGKKYMEDLIEGTLKKLSPDKKNKSSGGGSSGGGMSGGLTADSSNSSDDSNSPDTSPTPTPIPPGGAPQPQQPTAAQVATNTLSKVSSDDKGTTGLQKVKGQNDGTYWYDNLGNIYQITDKWKKILNKSDFAKGVKGSALGDYHFYRDLRNGSVSIDNGSGTSEEGWYDYAANAVREKVKGSGTTMLGSSDAVQWVGVDKSQKYKGQFNPKTNPYGPSTIKAEQGIRVGQGGNNQGLKISTSGDGLTTLSTPVKFDQLRQHHGGDKKRLFGITKDYILDGPSYPNYKVLTPVAATVKFAGDAGDGYGNSVELVDNKGNNLALFGHFRQLLVKTGDKISAGTALGIQGNTGESTGNHVHIDASKKFHEAWANYMLGVKTNLDASSLIDKNDQGPGSTPAEDSNNKKDKDSYSNPFESMQGLITNLSSALGMSSIMNNPDAAKEIDNKEKFDFKYKQ